MTVTQAYADLYLKLIYVAPFLCVLLHFCHMVTIETMKGEIQFVRFYLGLASNI